MKGKSKNTKGTSITTNPSAGAGNPTDQAQGETHTAPLRANKSYEGIVVGGDPNSFIYTIRYGDVLIEGAHWLGGINMGILGYKTTMFPTVGSRVKFIYGNPSLIIQGLPSDPRDDTAGFERMHTHSGVDRGNLNTPDHEDGEGASTHHTPAADQFEGEFEIANMMGMALKCCHFFMGMDAGERAKVEVHLLNDMVRIVSDTFKHFSAFGDMQIYNDGRLNVKFDGTSYEHEAWSLLSEEEEKAPVDEFQIEPEADLTKTGRWRFSQYIGFLGDFVHQFVTEPSATASSIADGAFRPGKSRIQQMADGSVLIQGIGDIAIERVCRVQVPVEKKRHDDPSGVNTDDFKELDQQFLKIWDYGGPSNSTIHHGAYQLREYARWLSCFHSYARFHQLEAKGGEWEIPLETESGCDPSWTNQEKDVEQGNPNVTYKDAYACWRIHRDGTIAQWDGYGNGIVSGKSGLQFSSTEHFEIDAAGDVRITAGQDVYVKARRNIEISAIAGGLILKACTWWKALVEKGVLWLKSDADDPDVDATTDNPRGSGVDYPDVEKGEYAVLIESSRGRTAMRSERTVLIAAEGTADSGAHNDISSSVIIQSRFQDVRSYALRNNIVKSQGSEDGVLGLEGATGVVVDTPKFFCTSYLFDIRQNAANEDQALTIRGGKLSVNQVAAKFVGAETRLAGPKRGPLAESPPPQGCCLPAHFNHCDEKDAFDSPDYASADDLAIRTSYEDSPTRNTLGWEDPFSGEDPEWAYPLPDDYQWPDESETGYPRFESLAQQRIRFDDFFDSRVDDWVWSTLDKLEEGPRTDTQNLPYPGRAAQELFHPDAAGDKLHEPLASAYNSQDTQTPLSQRKPEKKFRKRDQA